MKKTLAAFLLLCTMGMTAPSIPNLARWFADVVAKVCTKIPQPSDSPGAGTYTSTRSVTIADSYGGSTLYICYTIDGSAPWFNGSTCGNGTHYTGAFNISATATLKATACATNYSCSSLDSSLYTISSNPTVVQPTSGNPLAASCYTFNNGGGNATSCAYPVNLTSGNTAYILVIVTSAGTISAPPTLSSGTATLGTITAIGAGLSSADGVYQWYSASITGSGSATISATGSVGGNVIIAPFEVNNSGGIDTTSTCTTGTGSAGACYNHVNNSCTTGCSTVEISTATAGDLVLYPAASIGNPNTFSALTPFTLIQQDSASGNNASFMIGSYSDSSTGNVVGTFTQANGYQYWDAALAIK